MSLEIQWRKAQNGEAITLHISLGWRLSIWKAALWRRTWNPGGHHLKNKPAVYIFPDEVREYKILPETLLIVQWQKKAQQPETEIQDIGLKHKKKKSLLFKSGQTIEWVAQKKVVKIAKTQLQNILSILLRLTPFWPVGMALSIFRHT